MSRRSLVVTAGSLVLVTATAHAVVPRTTHPARVTAETLTALPAAHVTKPLRVHRTLRFGQRATAAWQRFDSAAGGRWRGAWDPATGVPSRMWGAGMSAPGANASAAVAERFARQILAAHIDLFAPGAAASDFVLVSNHDDGDQRSIGFVQYAGGLRVVSGQLSFRFKRDRLFVIGSEAFPNVKLAPAPPAMKPQRFAAQAATNLRTELALPNAPVAAKGDEVVLPLVADDAVLGYRRAMPFEIDGGFDGRYLAYVDPATGGVLAVHQQNTYANGTVLYRTVDRHPGRPRIDVPAHTAQVVVGGVAQTTSASGLVSWSPDVEAQTVTTGVTGSLVTIANKSTTATLASANLIVAPNGSTVWDASAVVEDDAQVVTFVSTNLVKEYVRANIDANMAKLDEPIVANVNIANTCNAFFDGEAINFFQATPSTATTTKCQNTGLLADVVFHEFGHNVHSREIIPGVGTFDGAMSEGASDFLSAIITEDPGMGRGFFLTNEPLRQLDPPEGAHEPRWPDDVGEIHKTGIIFGGAFWDLRKTLIAQHGAVAGIALTNHLYVSALRRATSIPTSLIEVLAADDDDGDLTNGSPNECAIREAFGRHGLRTATGAILAPGVLDDNAAQTIVRADLEGLAERCSGDEIDTVTLSWRARFTPQPTAGSAVMTQVNGTRYWAQMPLAIDGTTLFNALVKFKDGSQLTLPDNQGDPLYQVYQGSTVKLYCTDFETDPFLDGWTSGADAGESPWQWGEARSGGATDPPVAFSGTKLVGQVLGGDYAPGQYSVLKLPPIDIGQYSDVRLQFRRWLAVEDSEFDKARVIVDGKQAFVNFTENVGKSSSVHHIDREWRFQDVSVTGYGYGHTLQIAFDLQTDEGLQLGGWAIDDVCVVANRNSICGDGVKSLFEECDDGDGNADAPGACRTVCQLPSCGDQITDPGEACDDGEAGSDACTPTCMTIDGGLAGCCSSSGGAGSLVLGAVAGLVLLRRRVVVAPTAKSDPHA